MNQNQTEDCILAIDPCPYGLGFAVLEDSGHLAGCGLRRVGGKQRNARTLKQTAALIERYRPSVLVIEDWGAPGSRRRARVRRLLKESASLRREMDARPVRPCSVRAVCGGEDRIGMVNLTHQVVKPCRETGALNAQFNPFGFEDDYVWLDKSGNLGVALRVKGVDYECLDHSQLNHVSRRFEAALRSLSESFRLYQYIVQRDNAVVPHEK